MLRKFTAINVKNLKDTVVEQSNQIDNILQKDYKTKMYINKNNNDINVIQKYNNSYDVRLRLTTHGSNSLPQIATHFKRPNTGELIKSLDGFTSNLCVISTDSIGPYRGLNAKNNADGDSSNLDAWLGGYHGYDGNVNASVPVAKNTYYALYVDNILISDTDLHLVYDNAKVVVINQIQGCNTMKADGTGRYILEEKVIYTFKNLGEIDVEVEFKALEDLSINYYYGLQCPCASYDEGISFKNDNINKAYITNPFSQNYSSGNKIDSDCYEFVANKGNDCISMQLDNTYGLGRLRYNASDKIVNSITSKKKAYFNLITSKIDLLQSQVMSWRGKYKFYSK